MVFKPWSYEGFMGSDLPDYLAMTERYAAEDLESDLAALRASKHQQQTA